MKMKLDDWNKFQLNLGGIFWILAKKEEVRTVLRRSIFTHNFSRRIIIKVLLILDVILKTHVG